MRILNLTPDIIYYINPTIELTDKGIQDLDEVYNIDPDSFVNGDSIKNISRKYGPFDLILLKGGLFFRHGRVDKLNGPPDLFDCGIPILVLQMGDDLHGWRHDHGFAFDRLRTTGAFVLSAATSSQFFSPFTENTFQRESWLDPECYVALHPEVITNNERYLMFPHPVAENEFIPIDWGLKKYDVSVMGVQYYFRKKVIQYLKSTNKFKIKTKKDFIQQITSFLIGKSSTASNIYKERFIDIIRKSVASVTCAGSVGYPVRKYFEIPAFGAVLMAEFFRNSQDLGFVDEENCFYLSVDNMNDMDSKIEMLRSDSVYAQKIAEAGQQMVYENHRLKARLQQFLDIAQAVASGTLKTTKWDRGKLTLIKI